MTKTEKPEVKKIEGSVTVNNTGTVATQGLAISLQLKADGVNVGSAYVMPGVTELAASANETYSFAFNPFNFEENKIYTVEAAVTLNNGDNKYPSDDATPVGKNITLSGHNTITVTDTFDGGTPVTLGTVSSTTTFAPYARTFEDCQCEELKTPYAKVYTNTAKIEETGQTANASVTVNCYELSVAKTADPSFDRTYKWTIDKVGLDMDKAEVTALTLAEGQAFTVYYEVTVTEDDPVDSNWAVTGTITITNPNPYKDAVITCVKDILSDGTVANVTDADGNPIVFPLTVPKNGGSVTLKYSADLTNGEDCTNVVTVKQQNYAYDKSRAGTASETTEYTADAEVKFGDPTNEFDRCVDVYDDKGNPAENHYLGQVCFGDESEPFKYDVTLQFYLSETIFCGQRYTIKNTATIVNKDNDTIDDASWTIYWTIPCQGCTLTPGYWKTHSKYGPAPYDATWAGIGEDTTFFKSGMSYYQVLWTPPKGGNAYYILARAYVAAELNFKNGADPAAAQTAFNAAKLLFETYTPAQVSAWRGNHSERAKFIAYAAVLDNYNNGRIGPGHCNEDGTSAK